MYLCICIQLQPSTLYPGGKFNTLDFTYCTATCQVPQAAGCQGFLWNFHLLAAVNDELATFTVFAMADDKWIGLALAVSGSVAIGVSAIITKKVGVLQKCCG